MSDTDDMWRAIRDLRQEVRALRGVLGVAEERISALEKQTPSAQRLQHEADIAMADAAEYGRHGRDCQCAYCYDPDDDVRRLEAGR